MSPLVRFASVVVASVLATFSFAHAQDVEQWGIFEASFRGPTDGNPFTEVQLSARFTSGDQSFETEGFYDGDGNYRVRFMPGKQGEWKYETRSNRPELNGKTGSFAAGAPSSGNHGPLQVHRTFHFQYADGTPWFQVGTTCYAWVHQPEALQKQTLETLAKAPFNKLRMCVFPKSYTYNRGEPEQFAFPRQPDGKFDFTRFDPAFWQHFERRIADLQKLGIEADLILFHPYDKWGFAEMDDAGDDRYIRYAIARLAAYRNVWWSLANEYDLMAPGARADHAGNKTMEDWHRIFQLIEKHDPYTRMRSIHNWKEFYDYTKPWVTHSSIQSHSVGEVPAWRRKYGKPVIVDECGYEGNIPQGWGNLKGEEMVRRFWIGTVGGGYMGHGETMADPNEILWWSKGGVLKGESPPRLAFLKKTMEALPYTEMEPSRAKNDTFILAKPGNYLVFAGKTEPITIRLAGNAEYTIEGIDPWEMTTKPMGTTKPGEYTFTPPKANFVLKLTAADSAAQ